MEKIKLEILDLSPSQLQAGSFTLILSEVNGDRRLPIIIGMFEAQAIAIEMEKIKPSRPLSHDLFKSFAKAFDYSVEEVFISDISEGVFYSKIICTDGIRQKNVDARPSDAVAIALRFNANIYTSQQVMLEASISANDEEQESPPKPKSIKVKSKIESESRNLEQLKKQLEEAIQKEDYEKAAKIRDEIEKWN